MIKERQFEQDSQLQKWGDAAKAGFQIVPNVLFRAQQHLNLDAADVVILLNLTLHWWGAGRWPFPSPGIIARRMGVSRRTVERRIVRLEKLGFLKRVQGQAKGEGSLQQRKFDLSGLVAKLENAAAVGLAQRNYVKSQRRRNDPKNSDTNLQA